VRFKETNTRMLTFVRHGVARRAAGHPWGNRSITGSMTAVGSTSFWLRVGHQSVAKNSLFLPHLSMCIYIDTCTEYNTISHRAGTSKMNDRMTPSRFLNTIH
jgi:hypothetical protein